MIVLYHWTRVNIATCNGNIIKCQKFFLMGTKSPTHHDVTWKQDILRPNNMSAILKYFILDSDQHFLSGKGIMRDIKLDQKCLANVMDNLVLTYAIKFKSYYVWWNELTAFHWHLVCNNIKCSLCWMRWCTQRRSDFSQSTFAHKRSSEKISQVSLTLLLSRTISHCLKQRSNFVILLIAL